MRFCNLSMIPTMRCMYSVPFANCAPYELRIFTPQGAQTPMQMSPPMLSRWDHRIEIGGAVPTTHWSRRLLHSSWDLASMIVRFRVLSTAFIATQALVGFAEISRHSDHSLLPLVIPTMSTTGRLSCAGSTRLSDISNENGCGEK